MKRNTFFSIKKGQPNVIFVQVPKVSYYFSADGISKITTDFQKVEHIFQKYKVLGRRFHCVGGGKPEINVVHNDKDSTY